METEIGRVLTRLTSLGAERLARPGPDGTTPANRVRPVLQQLADAAAALEGRPPPRVPALAERALGDQLAVLGRDLLAAAAAAGRPGDGERALAAAAAELVALRRAL